MLSEALNQLFLYVGFGIPIVLTGMGLPVPEEVFVIAAGLSAAQAASLVRRMAGPFRLPDALRRVDALARTRHDHTTAARPETR